MGVPLHSDCVRRQPLNRAPSPGSLGLRGKRLSAGACGALAGFGKRAALDGKWSPWGQLDRVLQA